MRSDNIDLRFRTRRDDRSRCDYDEVFLDHVVAVLSREDGIPKAGHGASAYSPCW